MRRTLAVAAAAAASFIALSGTAQAAAATYVSSADLGTPVADCGATQTGWCTYYRGAGTAGLVDAAPGTPAGQHLQLSTPGGNDKAGAYEYNNRGNQLAGITTLSYSYLVTQSPSTAAGADWAPALNVAIDTNGPNQSGGYATLVYEPLYVTGYTTPTTRTWTTATPTSSDGGWWVTGTQQTGLQASQQANAGKYGGATWAEVQSYFPDATVYGIGFNQGSGNGGLTSQVDLLKVDDTTYDFAGTPQTADDCKSGGWQTYAERGFPNQGQCVSYVNTGNAPTATGPTANVPSGSRSVGSPVTGAGTAAAAVSGAFAAKMRAE